MHIDSTISLNHLLIALHGKIIGCCNDKLIQLQVTALNFNYFLNLCLPCLVPLPFLKVKERSFMHHLSPGFPFSFSNCQGHVDLSHHSLISVIHLFWHPLGHWPYTNLPIAVVEVKGMHNGNKYCNIGFWIITINGSLFSAPLVLNHWPFTLSEYLAFFFSSTFHNMHSCYSWF